MLPRQFSLLSAQFSLLADSVRHTPGRPEGTKEVWAEANSFFGHDAKHAKMARQMIKNSNKPSPSFHSAAYGKFSSLIPMANLNMLGACLNSAPYSCLPGNSQRLPVQALLPCIPESSESLSRRNARARNAPGPMHPGVARVGPGTAAGCC